MAYVAITRIALQPGNSQRMQEAVQALLDARRPFSAATCTQCRSCAQRTVTSMR